MSSSIPTGYEQRAQADICKRGPIRAASAPERADSSNISTVTGSKETPDCERRVAGNSLQLHRDQEEERAERGVHGEGDRFAASNWRERNNASGSIGWRSRDSST